MQSLTKEQGDGVLDLVSVCHRVTQAYEQKQAFERSGKGLSEAERRIIGQGVSTSFTLAMNDLADAYELVMVLGVNSQTTDYVLLKNLPEVVRDLLREAA